MFKSAISNKAMNNLVRLVECVFPDAEFNEFDHSIELDGESYYADSIKDIIRLLEKIGEIKG